MGGATACHTCNALCLCVLPMMLCVCCVKSCSSRATRDTGCVRGGRLTPDFSNVVSKSHIEKLAEADQHQVVQAVQVRWDAHARNTLPTMSP